MDDGDQDKMMDDQGWSLKMRFDLCAHTSQPIRKETLCVHIENIKELTLHVRKKDFSFNL